MTIEYVMILSIALVSGAVVIWPATVLCRRLGFSPFLGFLAIVPLANIALLWFVALSRWPLTQADGTARTR